MRAVGQLRTSRSKHATQRADGGSRFLLNDAKRFSQGLAISKIVTKGICELHLTRCPAFRFKQVRTRNHSASRIHLPREDDIEPHLTKR
jgi:hypothetical protein